MGIDDRVALVTGAGSGIGRSTALGLAEAGHHVVVADVSRDGAEQTVAEIEALGRTALPVTCDVREAKDLEGAVAAAVRAFGRLDAAVNNAGLGTRAVDIVGLSEEDWRLVIDTDLTGVWRSMKYEIPAMLESGGGTIVNMASVFGLVAGVATSPAYVAAKHGVVGLTRCAALHYATDGIRVNAICPGAIDTPGVAERLARQPGTRQELEQWHPMERLGTPDEVAAAAVWLCSVDSGFVTGATLAVDGGFVAR